MAREGRARWFEDWITKVDALIEKHRRKHKLRPLFEARRPGGSVVSGSAAL